MQRYCSLDCGDSSVLFAGTDFVIELACLEVKDLSEDHIHQLSKILDKDGLGGEKGAVSLAKRFQCTSEALLWISRAKKPTGAFLNHLSAYGSSEQRKLSFLIQKLMEEPAMEGAADILKQANKSLFHFSRQGYM